MMNISLTFSQEQLRIIDEGLHLVAYGKAAPLFDSINKQLTEQNKAKQDKEAAEQAAAEADRAELERLRLESAQRAEQTPEQTQ